jgi:serine/threonine protein kinase
VSELPRASGSLSATQLQRIDDACDRFETALRARQHPTIEAALDGYVEPERAVLARELHALERAYADAANVPIGETHPPGASERRTAVEITLPAAPPQRFGDYELLDKLGQGGMGEVFRARQLSADRIVVLKIIRRDRLEDLPADRRGQWLERFRVEALAAARMEHDAIVPVYQVGDVDEQPYYSMRFIRGRNLGTLVQDRPLPPERAARYIEKIARAVHHAHSRGILHRDIKPRNIIIDEEDRPYITDFGLAKWLLGEAVSLTAQGTLVGSPPYIAPEQIVDASAVTVAADIYSLGATLYHLLTGRPPFQASTVHETLRQVQHDDPVPPARLQSGLHRDLETICLKCLRKNPRRRYATALDLADDLHRYLVHEPIRARRAVPWERPVRWVQHHRAATLIGAALVVALVALAIRSWPDSSTGDGISVPPVHPVEPPVIDPKLVKIETARTVARAMYERGVQAWQRGQLDQANADFESAGEMLAELMRNGAATPAERLQLARADMGRGDWRIFRRDLGGAQRYFDHARLVLNDLHKEFPADAVYQVELALAHANLGVAAQPQEVQPIGAGLPPEAAHEYRQARLLLDALADPSTRDTTFERRLSRTQFLLGRGVAAQGDWPQAARFLDAAKAGQQAMVERAEHPPDDDDALASTENALAALTLARVQHARSMADLARQVLTGSPWTAGGLLYVHAASLKHARKQAEGATEAHHGLVEANPDHPRYRAHLRDDHATVVLIALNERDYAGAARAAERMPEAIVEAKAHAQECAYAAELLTLCADLARNDVALPKLERAKQEDKYASAAVKQLRLAAAGGWADWSQVPLWPTFAVLRYRADFRALTAGKLVN